jgi:hypothetical protein
MAADEVVYKFKGENADLKATLAENKALLQQHAQQVAANAPGGIAGSFRGSCHLGCGGCRTDVSPHPIATGDGPTGHPATCGQRGGPWCRCDGGHKPRNALRCPGSSGGDACGTPDGYPGHAAFARGGCTGSGSGGCVTLCVFAWRWGTSGCVQLQPVDAERLFDGRRRTTRRQCNAGCRCDDSGSCRGRVA